MAFWSVAIPAAMSLAGALTSRRKPPKVPQIDISGELAKIDALYDAQRQGIKGGLASELAARNRATSSSLANRGIYSSPVSQYAYGQNEQAYANALADSLASIAGQQANTRASLLGQLASQQQQQAYNAAMAKYQGRVQSRNALSSALMGAGIAGLSNAFSGMRGASTPTARAQSPAYTPPVNFAFQSPDMLAYPSTDNLLLTQLEQERLRRENRF